MLTKQEEIELAEKRRQKVDYSKIPKRPFFMDQDLKRTRGLPAPGQYAAKTIGPVKGNVAMKIDRINYLDEAIRDKQDNVAPGKYSPKVLNIIVTYSLERFCIQETSISAKMENT